jgi:lipid-binding SYLF domain-containing protein
MRRLALTCICLALSVAVAKANTPADQLQKATNVLNEIMKAPDKGIPDDLLAKAVCVGIVPSELKPSVFSAPILWPRRLGVLRSWKRSVGRPVHVHPGRRSFGFQLGGKAQQTWCSW